MRSTHALRKVASVLLDNPYVRHWGYQISKAAEVPSGVLYPMLTRMLNEGWIVDRWEDPTTITDGRSPRRYYVLTDNGREELDQILKKDQS